MSFFSNLISNFIYLSVVTQNIMKVSLTSSLNGLKSMSDSDPAVRRLLAKLARVLEAASPDHFGPQAVSHMLGGLK